MSAPKWTDRGEWRAVCVSDGARVVVGTGQSKVIIGRFYSLLPEAEMHANARLASAAPEMFQSLEMIYDRLQSTWEGRDWLKVWLNHPEKPERTPETMILYALAKAKGEL